MKIQNAQRLINEALAALPMGSDMQSEILKAATALNKAVSKLPQNPGMQATQLQQQARTLAQQGPAQQALQNLYPQQQGSGQPPSGGQPPQAQ